MTQTLLAEAPESFVAAPTAHLDHVVIMLDGDTHEAVVGSEFLSREFGRFKIKTANTTLAKTYTAAGLAGVNTLLEFFDVASPPLPDLVGALVFSFSVPGSMEAVRRNLESRLGTEVPYELVRRTVVEGEDPVPWYHLTRPSFGDGSPFILMLAEGVPEYFTGQLGAELSDDGQMHREAYLKQALGEPHRDDLYLRDIQRVTLRLSSERAETLSQCLLALGFQSSEAEPSVFRGADSEIHIVLAAAGETEGVVGVGAELQRSPSAQHTEAFGDGSELHLSEDGTARWSFEPPPQMAKAED